MNSRIKVKIPNYIETKRIIISIMIVAFFSSDLVNFLTEGNYTAILTYFRLFDSFVLLILSYHLNEIRYVNRMYMAFFGIALISIALSSLYNRNISIIEVIWYFEYIFVFAVLFKVKVIPQVVLIGYLIFTGYFITFIISGNSVYLLETGHGSRNVVGYGLTMLCVLFYISQDQNSMRMKFSIVLPVIMIFVTLWTGSRSGITTSCLLLVGDLLGKRNEKNSKLVKRIIILLLLLYVAYIYVTKSGIIDNYLLAYSTKIDLRITDDTRWEIILGYIKCTLANPLNLLFGTKLSSVPILNAARVSGNPHNMFIRMHANFGIVFFITVCAGTFNSLRFLFKNNRNMLFVFLALILRGFSDIVGFTGPFDPLMYYFIFYSFYSMNTSFCAKNAGK